MTYMRLFILILLLGCSAHAEVSTNDCPLVFGSLTNLQTWAVSSAFGGGAYSELSYKQHRLVVCFRQFTSGVVTSEPSVYVQKDGNWIRILAAKMCYGDMKATIEGDALVLWRLGLSKDKKEKTEYLRFDLKNLDAA